MDIMNPATGAKIQSLQPDDALSIREKFAIAREAQKKWALLSLTERIKIIASFATLLQRDIDIVSQDLTLETGKPITQSRNEVNGSLNKIRFFVEEIAGALSPKHIRKDGSTEEILSFDPLGVVLNISAWNYPILVGFNVFLPALLCGNAVLYKPSEFSTLTGLHLTRLLHEAGVPSEVFACVVGDSAVGSELLKLPFDCIGFTGSYATGRTIAQSVAGRMTRLIMELGGKDPLYVTDDCGQLDKVAESVAEGVLYNNGQSCCAVERVYVHESIYEDFLIALKSKMSLWTVGDPLDEKTMCGALTRSQHVGFLLNQVDDAVNKGGRLLLGGKASSGQGSFFEPTLVADANHSMELMREESFGPVIGVMKVRDDSEAVELMNDSDYGLTSAVFCQNHERGRALLARINTGTGYLNCCDRVSAWLPWSGRNHSGLGTTLSSLGIYAFCHAKGLHLRG